MAIPSHFLDELRERTTLSDVVGKRVRLVKKGHEHSGLCPFHKEKTPSFTVSDTKGFYHCFGCGAHGSAFDFVMETEGLGFREAVEKLASELAMVLPQDSPEDRHKAQQRKSLYDVVEAACRYFETALHQSEGAHAMAYLHARGLTDDTITAFRLGVAPQHRDGLVKALEHQGMTQRQMIDAGLLIKRDDGSTYERFRGRVIFPILDRRARVVAFGGRILDSQTDAPKYLNSPETDLFHKGRLLYALDTAQVDVRAGQTLIVTEGYMDVIALNQAGFAGALAPLGTALTDVQILELWKIAPEPVLCFDGDRAGARASARAAQRALPLLRAGAGLRFATLPPGEDPDSLIRGQGAGTFQAVLDAATPLSAVLWNMELSQSSSDTPEGRAALQKRLDDHVRHIEDATVRSHFQFAFKDRLWRLRRESGGAREFKSRGRKAFAPVKPPVFDTKNGRQAALSVHIDKAQVREKILITALITHPDLFDEVGEKLGNLAFSTVALDNLRQEVLKTLAQDAGLDTEAFQRHLKESGYTEILDALFDPRIFGHAFFARPQVPFETALEGWYETYELYNRRDLEAELLEAQRRLAANMTTETFERFRALKIQEQTAQDQNAK